MIDNCKMKKNKLHFIAIIKNYLYPIRCMGKVFWLVPIILYIFIPAILYIYSHNSFQPLTTEQLTSMTIMTMVPIFSAWSPMLLCHEMFEGKGNELLFLNLRRNASNIIKCYFIYVVIQLPFYLILKCSGVLTHYVLSHMYLMFMVGILYNGVVFFVVSLSKTISICVFIVLIYTGMSVAGSLPRGISYVGLVENSTMVLFLEAGVYGVLGIVLFFIGYVVLHIHTERYYV